MSKNKITELVSIFRFRPVVFFGAGVSFNSGIPLVIGNKNHEGMIDNIMRHLDLSEGQIQEVIRQEIPFEVFIEDLQMGSDIKPLLEIFELGSPNHAHKFFAHCAKKGIVTTFVTTNFDLLLETALEEAGVVYDTFSSDSEFLKINWESNRTKLIKLHGTVADKSQLGIIIRNVAQKRYSKEFQYVLRHIFSKDICSHILFLGYSCSDVFDISPIIESLQGQGAPEIHIIEHGGEELVDIGMVSAKDKKNPFHGYSGRRYSGNTDLALECLSEAIGFCDFKRISIQNHEWKTFTLLWSTLFLRNKEAILAKIKFDVSALSSASQHWALAIKTEADDENKFILCLNALPALTAQGRFDEAENHLSAAMLLLSSISNPLLLATFYTNMGELKIHKACYTEALDDLQKAEHLLKENETGLEGAQMARILANIGEAFLGMGNLSSALTMLEQANALGRTTGELISQAMSLRGMSKIYAGKLDYIKAILTAQAARELWGCLSAHFYETATVVDIAEYQRHIGDIESSLKNIRLAIDKSKEAGWAITEAVARGNLALIYIEQGAFSLAEDEILFAIGNTTNLLSLTYQINYGVLLNKMNRPQDGVRVLMAAVESLRFRSMDYSWRNELRRALLNLSVIYLDMELESKAVEAATQSYSIAKALDNLQGKINAKVNIGVGLVNSGSVAQGSQELREALSLAQSRKIPNDHDAYRIKSLLNSIRR